MSTTASPLPSLRALGAADDRLLDEELCLLATRRQIAVVRALADELERCVQGSHLLETLRAQFVEELSRLGCSTLEAAAALAKVDLDTTGAPVAVATG
ncbi:MAG TPA: hypothetical protein VF765_29670 [Polyangiaceae bacterium]